MRWAFFSQPTSSLFLLSAKRTHKNPTMCASQPEKAHGFAPFCLSVMYWVWPGSRYSTRK